MKAKQYKLILILGIFMIICFAEKQQTFAQDVSNVKLAFIKRASLNVKFMQVIPNESMNHTVNLYDETSKDVISVDKELKHASIKRKEKLDQLSHVRKLSLLIFFQMLNQG
ncbi:MAG: hypothetical protein ACE5KZ_12965 [Candidatus Scalinduaceae bacterium]